MGNFCGKVDKSDGLFDLGARPSAAAAAALATAVQIPAHIAGPPPSGGPGRGSLPNSGISAGKSTVAQAKTTSIPVRATGLPLLGGAGRGSVPGPKSYLDNTGSGRVRSSTSLGGVAADDARRQAAAAAKTRNALKVRRGRLNALLKKQKQEGHRETMEKALQTEARYRYMDTQTRIQANY